MSDDRMKVTIMGVEVGIASGFDQYTDIGYIFYDFEPADWTGDHLACEMLAIDYETGEITLQGDDEPEIKLTNKQVFALLSKAP